MATKPTPLPVPVDVPVPVSADVPLVSPAQLFVTVPVVLAEHVDAAVESWYARLFAATPALTVEQYETLYAAKSDLRAALAAALS